MRDGFTTEPVFRQTIAPGYAQGVPANESFPEAAFCAGRTVALARTLIEIDIRLEADRAAMTTAVIGFLHLISLHPLSVSAH
jgi:hypothetical protein